MPRPTLAITSSWQQPKQHCGVSILDRNNTALSQFKQACAGLHISGHNTSAACTNAAHGKLVLI